MSLFDLNALVVKEKDPGKSFFARYGALLGRSLEKLKRDMPKEALMQPDAFFTYKTKGNYSAHEVLFYLLSITGPASVYISTWSISEKSLRILNNAIEDGLIADFYAVFDRRMSVRKESLTVFAKRIATHYAMVDCHAKVLVVENESYSFTVITSANMNRNKRIEVGVIINAVGVASFHKGWILEEIQKQQKG